MTQKPVPILCAECNATITVATEMLDGAYACEKCGAAIDFTLYEPLEAMIEERREAARIVREKQDAEKKRARDKQREAERAEAERVRAEHEAKKRRDMENRADEAAVRLREEAQRRADEQRKHPLGQPPAYSFLQSSANIIRLIGFGTCQLSTAVLLIFCGMALASSRSVVFTVFLSSILPVVTSFVSGVFLVGFGEAMLALRNIAILTHQIAEKQ